MKRLILSSMLGMVFVALLGGADLSAQRRRVVVRRGPVRRTTIVVRPGHPIRRVLPQTVVVRPARHVVVVGAPIVFLPALVWRPRVIALPPREHLTWQDSEVLSKEEEWVDCNFGVDHRGDALYLEIEGKARLNFAEITFENGNVQVVDFEDSARESGKYSLLDFADGRVVKTVRVLARSESDETTLNLYLKT